MPKKTKFDPTGQARNRKRAVKGLLNKLLKIRKRVRVLYKTIPKIKRSRPITTNTEEVYYEYLLIPGAVSVLKVSITDIVNSELEIASDTVPANWFYKPNVEQPYRDGTAEQVNRSNNQIEQAVALGLLLDIFRRRVTPLDYLRSPQYFTPLQEAFSRNYSEIRSLGGRVSARASQVIIDALDAGLKPSEVIARINDTFDAEDARATRLVNTEVNRAYNDAIMQTASTLADEANMTSGVQHISARLPTTRPHHEARHRQYYSVEAQQQWWSEGTNRINCHCTVIPVLLDQNGQPINRENGDANT